MILRISFAIVLASLMGHVALIENDDLLEDVLEFVDPSIDSDGSQDSDERLLYDYYEDIVLQECSIDEDCEGSSMKCIRNKCIPKARLCESSDTCPVDMECLAGTCLYVDNGQKCDESEDCREENYKCHLPKGVCYFSLCQSSRDCPGDSSCVLGKCSDPPCGPSRNCPGNHTCVLNKCVDTKNAESKLCKSHGDCLTKLQVIDVACINAQNGTRFCHLLDCEHDEDCPADTACHHDIFHSYCSAFKCKEDKDCANTQAKIPTGKSNRAVCQSGKCVLRGKACYKDSQCSNTRELCLHETCAQKNCSSDEECPSRSKCHPSKSFCRKMACTSVDDCIGRESCEDGYCVVPLGSKCRHHVHCYHSEICGGNRTCEKRSCRVDVDCKDERLSCHPENFCTASLDYALGMQLSKAYATYQKVGYFQKPLEDEVNITQEENEEMDREIEQALDEIMSDFPAQEDLEKWENNYYDELDLRTSRQGQNYSEHTKFRSSAGTLNGSNPIKHRRMKRQGNSPIQGGFINQRRPFRRPSNSLPNFVPVDTTRFNGGDPALGALGSYGEALLTVSEQILRHTKLNPLKAAKILQRKKHPYCRWRTATSNAAREVPSDCSVSSALGDPRFTRLWSGACNNLEPDKKHYGLNGLPFSRLQPPDYSDGINSFRVSKATGEPLPNPRVISNRLSFALGKKLNNIKPPDNLVNANFLFFAQFVDHDLTNTFPKTINASTPVFGSFQKTSINCCGEPNANYSETYVTPTRANRFWCISIKIPETDPVWSSKPPSTRKECLHQQVTTAAPDWECHLGPRQIMNQVSNWLDLSQIYNSKKDFWDRIPNVNTNDRAKILMDGADGGKGYLPRCPAATRARGEPPISCASCALSPLRTPGAGVARSNCFIGGDFRTDENVALAAHQTIWAREHNRIVDVLRNSNPSWSANKLFHEARRINTAQYQHIIYNEFLPLLIGPEMMAEMKLYSSKQGYTRQYDPSIDPTIQNVFATVSYRFGHSMLPDKVNLLGANNEVTATYDINDIVFNFNAFNNANFFTQLFRGMIASPAGMASGFFAAKARDAVNASPDSAAPNANIGGFDLLAWNINRGRDHGIPAYHTWVELTNKQKPQNWKFFERFWERGPLTVLVMKSLYKSWKDMDLYIAGLLEAVKRDRFGKRNQVLGPTHSKIIASQFARLRRADRFFYDDNTDPNVAFNPNEINEIKKVSMSMILCNNLNNDGGNSGLKLWPHAFLQQHATEITPQRKQNPPTGCSQILSNQPNYSSFIGLSNIA